MNDQLKLSMNGLRAALPPDAEISLKKENCLLSAPTDEATYPFTLPLDANRHILGHPDRPANAVPVSVRPASVVSGACVLLDGISVLTGCSGGEAELYISSGQRAFWNLAKTTLLTAAVPRYDNSHASATASLAGGKPFVACTLWNSAAKAWINPYSGGLLNQYGNIVFPRLGAVLRAALSSLGYTLGLGYLGEFPWFENILIVYLGYADPAKAVLPEISVEELITDVETRFGVWFDVDEPRRAVLIRSMNQFPEQPLLHLRAFDRPEITFLEENEYRMRHIFADGGEDEFVSKWHTSFSVGTGKDEKRECLSSQLGTTVVDGRTVGAVSNGVASVTDFKPSREFRLAVYHGIRGGVPLMDNRGLEWESVYTTFHRRRTEMFLARRRTAIFWIDARDPSVLSAWKNLFRGYVAVGGCRCLVATAELKLSSAGVQSLELEATPV